MVRVLFEEQKTTLQIYYYMPDYRNIIQEFTWQFIDSQPEFRRTHAFLNYWHKNIEAKIQNIYLSHCDYWGNSVYRNVTEEFSFK